MPVVQGACDAPSLGSFSILAQYRKFGLVSMSEVCVQSPIDLGYFVSEALNVFEQVFSEFGCIYAGAVFPVSPGFEQNGREAVGSESVFCALQHLFLEALHINLDESDIVEVEAVERLDSHRDSRQVLVCVAQRLDAVAPSILTSNYIVERALLVSKGAGKWSDFVAEIV